MIHVIDPGPLTTIQDLGRTGQLRHGIPPSGPIDQTAFVLANRLVGNDDGAAALECTLSGPRFETDGACVIAVTGADVLVTVNDREAPRWSTIALNPRDVVHVGPAATAVRAYIALSGGLDVPPILGSRSTYLRGRLGGLGGRALRKGDTLRLFEAGPPRARTVNGGAIPDYAGEPTIHVILGPQADRFTEEGLATFLGESYEMTPQSDRMGARLRGRAIGHRRGHDIISDGIALGGIQVPGDGQPIALLVDRQSTGGYTKIATVCSFDIGRLGQVRPGRRLRFRAIAVAEAHRRRRDAEALLHAALSQEG